MEFRPLFLAHSPHYIFICTFTTRRAYLSPLIIYLMEDPISVYGTGSKIELNLHLRIIIIILAYPYSLWSPYYTLRTLSPHSPLGLPFLWWLMVHLMWPYKEEEDVRVLFIYCYYWTWNGGREIEKWERAKKIYIAPTVHTLACESNMFWPFNQEHHIS